MRSDAPSTKDTFGQTLPSPIEEMTPQQIADMDARAEHATAREAVRAEQVERFMLLPMSKKFRVLHIGTREVRDVAVMLKRDQDQLVMNLQTIIGNMQQTLEALQNRIQDLEELTPKAQPPLPEQLGLDIEIETMH